MTPNLYLCARTVVRPDTWVSRKHNRSSSHADRHLIEHWDSPVPGTYEFFPGRGWYLTHRDYPIDNGYESGYESDQSGLSASTSTTSRSTASITSTSSTSSTFSICPKGEEVRYCRILHRYFLASELEARCRWGPVIRGEGNKAEICRFFRLDDGISWVLCWDSKGRFLYGPYRKYFMDQETGHMRPMTRGKVLER